MRLETSGITEFCIMSDCRGGIQSLQYVCEKFYVSGPRAAQFPNTNSKVQSNSTHFARLTSFAVWIYDSDDHNLPGSYCYI